MRRAIIAACAAASLLAACASTTAPSPQVVLADVGTAIDTTYNVAGTYYLAVAPSLDAGTKAKVKALFAQAYVAVTAADAAVMVGDAATVQAQVQAAQTLINSALALLPAKS